jgi:hypothetical protein
MIWKDTAQIRVNSKIKLAGFTLKVPEYGPFRPKHSARSAVKSGGFFWGERPLATALPVLRLHLAIFDFGYGSLKTPVVGPRKNTLATRDPQSGREIVVTEPPRRLFVGPWLVTALRGLSLRRIGMLF